MIPEASDSAPTWNQIQQATGKGVRVLVVDSGIESAHPAFQGRPIRCWIASAGRYPARVAVIRDEHNEDVLGHGTAVGEIIHRHAPDATLDSLRVLGPNRRCSSRLVLDALRWGVENGYDVINCSFGTQQSFMTLPNGQLYNLAEGYRKAVTEAFVSGSILVSACSNSNVRTIEYPAYFPSVISVNYGAHEGLAFQRRPELVVDFEASGADIRVAWKNAEYKVVTGSSFATPHMSALVARIKQLRPHWNSIQTITALYNLADDS